MAKIALGTSREAAQPDCIKALVIEFVTTFLFVFAGVGSSMAAGNHLINFNNLHYYILDQTYFLLIAKGLINVVFFVALIKTDRLGADALVGLFAVAVAHAFVVAVMISGGHISGGHLNPAVTLGLLFGGHITLVRSILYWIDQLLASSAACILLKYLTGGLVSWEC